MLQAWGDESGSVASRDPGTYLLGAVIVAVDRLDDLRAAMRAVPRRGGSKLHWSSDDGAGHRRTLMAALEVDLEAFVVVRVGGLRIEHVPGPAEPALWLADAVCGAVVAYRLGDDRWIRLIDKRATIELIGGAT